MKTNGQPKIRGGSAAELTRLKALSPDAREEIWSWRSELNSEKATLTNAEIRGRIQERFSIRLNHDGQLSTFWQWQYRQMQYDRLGELASEDEEQLAQKFPNADRDKIREKTILRMYALADLEEDPQFALKVVNTDLKDNVVSIDRRKVVVLERKAAQADQAKGILEDKELTIEARTARMKEVFGIA
jgi:hypothetical protein